MANYIVRDLIISELRGKTAAEAIAELCSALSRQQKLSDARAFCEAVITRERLSSTSFAPGWATPHGRVNSLGELSFAFGRCAKPLSWFDRGMPVNAIFLFVVPEAEAKTYLDLIATLAKLNQNSALLNQLLAAPDHEALFRIFDQAVMGRSQRPGEVIVN